jgi:hypothetical protein
MEWKNLYTMGRVFGMMVISRSAIMLYFFFLEIWSCAENLILDMCKYVWNSDFSVIWK